MVGLGSCGSREVQLHSVAVGPAVQGPARELRAIVTSDGLGQAALETKLGQSRGDVPAFQMLTRPQAETLPRATTGETDRQRPHRGLQRAAQTRVSIATLVLVPRGRSADLGHLARRLQQLQATQRFGQPDAPRVSLGRDLRTRPETAPNLALLMDQKPGAEQSQRVLHYEWYRLGGQGN